MLDFSFAHVISEISALTSFGMIYLVGTGFLFGAIIAFYMGMRTAIGIGVVLTAIFFLYLSYQASGVITQVIPDFLSYFRGMLYTIVGLVVGALIAQLLFRSNRY